MGAPDAEPIAITPLLCLSLALGYAVGCLVDWIIEAVTGRKNEPSRSILVQISGELVDLRRNRAFLRLFFCAFSLLMVLMLIINDPLCEILLHRILVLW